MALMFSTLELTQLVSISVIVSLFGTPARWPSNQAKQHGFSPNFPSDMSIGSGGAHEKSREGRDVTKAKPFQTPPLNRAWRAKPTCRARPCDVGEAREM